MPRPGKRTPAQITLGKRVRAERLAQGLSQMELADQIGLHFTFVSSVERGERNLSFASLLRLADGLGINLADLVEGLHWSDK